MTESEYVLTSAPEVHDIAEHGRRLSLVLAADSIGAAQRSALWSLLDAMHSGSFNDYDQACMVTDVNSHMHEARQRVKQSCQSERFDRERYGYVTRIARLETVPALHHTSQSSWNSSVRAIMAGYAEYRSGAILERLTAFYEATDPALPDDYGKALFDA